MKTIRVTTDKESEDLFFSELHTYTKMYFEYQQELFKTHDDETLGFLKDFVAYCKDKIYYYANKLTELNNTKGDK